MAIVIILFITFILSMVYKATQTSSDLVMEDYYRNELQFQEEINALSRAKKYNRSFSINPSSDSIKIELPVELNKNNFTAKISFYRPNNSLLDFETKITKFQKIIPLSKKKFLPGKYSVNVLCEVNEKLFLFKEDIAIK